MINQSSFQQIQYISFTERIKIITIKYLIIFSLYLFTTSLQFYLYIFFYFYVIFFLLNLLLFLAFYVFESVSLKNKISKFDIKAEFLHLLFYNKINKLYSIKS